MTADLASGRCRALPAEGRPRRPARAPQHRTATVSAPRGPLSLTGTRWISDYPEGRIPAAPGQWREDGDEGVLSAAVEDGLTATNSP